MTDRERALATADALEKCDWNSRSIGNNLLVLSAIKLLRALAAPSPAPAPRYEWQHDRDCAYVTTDGPAPCTCPAGKIAYNPPPLQPAPAPADYPKPELPEQYGHDPHDTTRENYLRNVKNNAPAPAPASLDDIAREEWQTLLEKDDRTSPEEYPDMALITQEEFAAALRRAAGEVRDAVVEAFSKEMYGADWPDYAEAIRAALTAAAQARAK